MALAVSGEGSGCCSGAVLLLGDHRFRIAGKGFALMSAGDLAGRLPPGGEGAAAAAAGGRGADHGAGVRDMVADGVRNIDGDGVRVPLSSGVCNGVSADRVEKSKLTLCDASRIGVGWGLRAGDGRAVASVSGKPSPSPSFSSSMKDSIVGIPVDALLRPEGGADSALSVLGVEFIRILLGLSGLLDACRSCCVGAGVVVKVDALCL